MRAVVLFFSYVMTRGSSLWSGPLSGPTAKKDPEGGRSFGPVGAFGAFRKPH
mgnify:CR=1 FL=1